MSLLSVLPVHSITPATVPSQGSYAAKIHTWPTLSHITSHTATYCLPVCPHQQLQSRLPWLCCHGHKDCFPSNSNYKSIRAGLASGKWNQLLPLSQDEDLNDLPEYFCFLPLFFSAIQWIPSLLISLPVGMYQMFLLLTYCQKGAL